MKKHLRIRPFNFIICVLLPITFLTVAKFNFESLKDVVNVYNISILALIGLASDFAYRYRKKVILKEIGEDGRSLKLIQKVDLALILIIPILFSILITILIVVTTNQTIFTSNNLLEERNKATSENFEPLKGPDIVHDKVINVIKDSSIEKEVVLFMPDLDSEIPIQEQFVNNAYKVLEAKSPMTNATADELIEARKVAQSYFPLLVEGKWEEIVELIDKRSSSNPDLANVIMNVAANMNAPLDFFIQLANRGGELNSHSLLALIKNDEFEKVISLENHGSNMKSEILDNTNILHLALLTPIKQEAFDFILDRVEVIDKVGEFGVDTLGIAIINAKENRDNAPHFLNELLSKGATIKPQHKLLMAGLKRDSADVYDDIVYYISDLQF